MVPVTREVFRLVGYVRTGALTWEVSLSEQLPSGGPHKTTAIKIYYNNNCFFLEGEKEVGNVCSSDGPMTC